MIQINISALPWQEFSVVLDGQNCVISLRQVAEHMYCNLTCEEVEIFKGRKVCVETDINTYAVRVIDQVLTASGTIQIADLKPQGNIKAGDTVVGTDGRMFRISSVNTTAGTALLSADYTDLTPSVSYEAPQTLSATQQNTARSNIGFSAGVDSWADDSFNDRTDDYLCPILEELILENGGTQQEIDDIKNAQTGQDAGTENP